MAKVYIAEFGDIRLGLPVQPPLAEQTVTIGASSTQSNAFHQHTRYIRVHTDAIMSFAIGPNPAATVNNARMAANATEYFEVQPGHKIAVVTNT
jgi:hypothetical protein